MNIEREKERNPLIKQSWFLSTITQKKTVPHCIRIGVSDTNYFIKILDGNTARHRTNIEKTTGFKIHVKMQYNSSSPVKLSFYR